MQWRGAVGSIADDSQGLKFLSYLYTLGSSHSPKTYLNGVLKLSQCHACIQLMFLLAVWHLGCERVILFRITAVVMGVKHNDLKEFLTFVVGLKILILSIATHGVKGGMKNMENPEWLDYTLSVSSAINSSAIYNDIISRGACPILHFLWQYVICYILSIFTCVWMCSALCPPGFILILVP